MPCDRNFLAIGLKNYVNLHTLELNTSQIDDLTLNEISPYFPDTLKHLYLIDNKITDDGIENMYKYIKKDGL